MPQAPGRSAELGTQGGLATYRGRVGVKVGDYFDPSTRVLAARCQKMRGWGLGGGAAGAGHPGGQIQPPVQVTDGSKCPANHRCVVIKDGDAFGAVVVDAGDRGMLV